MAAIPVEVRGTLYDLQTKSSRQVFLVGEASRSDLQVGGGPMPGGDLGIWGPTDPRPTPPIHLPPEQPPEVPPGTPPNSVVKAAPEGGGWGYYTDENSALYAAYRPAAGGAGPR